MKQLLESGEIRFRKTNIQLSNKVGELETEKAS